MAEAKKKEKAKVVKETKKEEKVTKKVKKDVKKKDKKDMIKYSIATIVFIVFCSLFFYAVEIIFALIQALFN